MKKIFVLILFSIFMMGAVANAEEEARLMRFPAVYENQVVFSYAGDLYSVDIAAGEGTARKLTGHNGYEMFPRFSPDGKFIAFTAQYDGNTEVYLMEAGGGIPKRLTYSAVLSRDDISDRMGPNNIVMGWQHDNKHIIFRSRMIEPNDFNGQLFLTTIEGDLQQQIPLPRGGFCSFSADDTKMAYNRVFREFRTWKRYRGGMADDIWIYDFKNKTVQNITDHPAQDIIPMWKDDNIYFLSDRDTSQRMNLYVYNTKSNQIRQLTQFKDYDIKFPSLGKDLIVFENGGYLYLFNTANEEVKKLKIFIKDDRLNGRGGIKKVKNNITNFEVSPDGKRALFGARGEIFTVPAKYGNTRNMTRTAGIHERNATGSPDGKWIAYISDESGENEIYIMPRDGQTKAVQLTQGADTYYFEILWSPDSQKILWGDRKLRLRYVDIQKKTVKTVTQSKFWEIRDFSWSPDSKWLAYSNTAENLLRKIYLYSLEKDQSYPVTDDWYNSASPSFSSCGKYLFFVSSRDYNPTMGETGFESVYVDMAKIYLLTLAKETPSPFQPKSDEVEVKKTPAKEEKSKDKKETEATPAIPVVKVDIDGITDRVVALPVTPSRYWSLVSVKNNLYYLKRGNNDSKTTLFKYDLEKQKETELGTINAFAISADQKKMMVAQTNTYAIIDLPEAPVEIKEPLNLDNMDMKLCLKSEWQNIFYESWRQMRDFFYLPGMHGLDWKKMREKYGALLPHVNHRFDLTYIIGEMIGELNIGHAYVGGGESPAVEKVNVGLLGAKLEKDLASGYYRIKKIYMSQNWDKIRTSPLRDIGVDAKVGDYIIAVDGQSTASMKNIYEALVNTAGKQVKLRLNSTPSEKNSREVAVVPINNELQLVYYDWVQNNIDKVNQASGGKVGYIHIPNMGLDGLNEFTKLYFPQLTKKALIIDVRGNGGGFVSPLVIDKLRREMAMVGISRYTSPTTDPDSVMIGPKVCLCDEFSASDGDIFPYRFKKHQLGKVIGKRTWGGVVGIRDSLPLLDGGFLFRPEFASYDTEGKEWIIEGRGVEPDIYVDNDPVMEFNGIDQQLNKGIEVILEELKTKEKILPPPPPEPDKSVK